MTMPTWISEVQALSLPIIAVGGWFIARQQYRVARQKLKFDLYERRFNVYSCLLDAVVTALNETAINTFDTSTRELNQRIREARFLFDAKTFDYCNRIETNVLQYRNMTLSIRQSDFHQQSEAQSLLTKHHRIANILDESMTSIHKVMHPYLNIDDRLSLSLSRSSEVEASKFLRKTVTDRTSADIASQ